MNALHAIATLLSVVITTPIWYWLMYRVLIAVQATELMWFLFWVSVPIGLLCQVIVRLVEIKR